MKNLFLSIAIGMLLSLTPISFAQTVQKPAALQAGDTVGLVSTGFRMLDDMELQFAIERLQALGFKVKVGDAILKQHGYFAGTDAQRVDDIHKMFADKDVKAIFQLRGGFGSARLLNLLDYDLIKKNPKVFMGMSDTTALLLAIYAKTGLVTFHGPNASRPWPKFTQGYLQSVLFNNEQTVFSNPVIQQDDLTQTEDRIQTITPGTAKGRLLGGNLVVLASMMGSDYLPEWDNAILFIEDIGEDPYKIDRALTQLKLAGVLDKISGFIFGKCNECVPTTPGSTYGSFHLMQVLNDHIKPLNIPAYYGAMIGHDSRIFTVPVGVVATMDASKGTIALQEHAVQ
ncbi:MAG: LD-carboxypeptidase [Legionellales bacterium]|jgi:muramoyltetrapeptide carboxypeptidase